MSKFLLYKKKKKELRSGSPSFLERLNSFISETIGSLLYWKCVFSMPEIPCSTSPFSPFPPPLPPIVISPYPCLSPHPPLQITYFLQSPPVEKFIVLSWMAYKSVKSHFNSLAFMWVDWRTFTNVLQQVHVWVET